MTRQEVFDQFINQVKKARSGLFQLAFNEKTSCLSGLVSALRKDIISGTMQKPAFDGLIRTLKTQSPHDSKKYEPALKWLEQNWPNWNHVAHLKNAVNLHKQREIKATKDVQLNVSQEQDYRDGNGPLTFQWNAFFSLTELPTQLLVKVRVKTLETGTVDAQRYTSDWQRHILTLWNNRASIKRRGQIDLEIQFQIEWLKNNSPVQCYEVNVSQPSITWPKIYEKTGPGRWVKHEVRQLDGRTVGTPDMLNWGAQDTRAIVHEFGHMIGLPDEYYTTKYNGHRTDPKIYNRDPFTTDSIMNNTNEGGSIQKRHFQTILDEYKKWQNDPNAEIVFE